jgi:hypothetical protein
MRDRFRRGESIPPQHIDMFVPQRRQARDTIRLDCNALGLHVCEGRVQVGFQAATANMANTSPKRPRLAGNVGHRIVRAQVIHLAALRHGFCRKFSLESI